MSDFRRPKRGKTRLLLLAVIVAGLGAALYFWQRPHAADISYREAAVERGNIRISVLATGAVQPENRVEIKPPIAGRAEQVLVQEGESVAKGQILAWMSSTERAALLDAARARGPAELKRWEGLYRPTPVIAPVDGTVILRSVESGQTFTNADSILVISDRLIVRAQVDETDIAQIRRAQPAEVVLDAYPDRPIPAQVDQIAFEATTVNNVTIYYVDLLPAATPPFMRSGMTANVTFVIESKENVLLVPTEAVKVDGNAATVLVRGADGQPRSRVIETGLSDGKRTEVLSGLAAGDRVLVAQIGPPSTVGTNPFSPSRRRPSSSSR